MFPSPVLALAALLALTASACAQNIEVNKNNKTIAITATDAADTESDTADISIGFTAYGATRESIYADASRTSNTILDALLASHLKRDQIRSNQQQLAPLGADNPEDRLRFDKGIRFFFSQTWTVTASAVQAAEVLHTAITAGANNSGNIEWRLADDNALDAQAATKALAHAQQIATQMAAGLHAHLGPLIYASNEQPQRGPLGRLMKMSASASSTHPNLQPLAIVPDKVTRSATVYAVFAIE